MSKNAIKIKLKAFDHRQIDQTAQKLVLLARELNVDVRGPIPLPTKREVFTILRSVHINKKSREQFESRTYKRLIVLDVDSSNEKAVIDKIKRTQLPAGVEIDKLEVA